MAKVAVNTSPVNQPTAPVNAAGTYYPVSQQSDFETKAKINAPQYYSVLDSNGQLKTPFQVDPTQSAAFRQMQDTATSTDLSPWAKMQEQSLGMQTAQQRDTSNAQQQGATDQALQQMMTTGNGADSGGRALAAAMGARSNIMANQNIGAQAAANDLNIQQQDAQNKASMLGQVMNTQTSAQAANANTANQDLANANQFASNRYNQQMQAWGAKQTAAAQMAAANGAGGKGGK